MNSEKGKHDHHISITVITVDGNYTGSYNPSNPLQKVVEKTMQELHLAYDLSQYGLYRVGGTDLLDLNQKIEQVGLTDGAELELRKNNAGGGGV